MKKHYITEKLLGKNRVKMGELRAIIRKRNKTLKLRREITIALEKKEEMEKDKDLNILYIFVSEDSWYKIKGKKFDEVGELEQEYKQHIETFKDEVHKLASSEEDIKERGAKFYEGLIPSDVRDVLKNEKIDWVWIDCRRKEINPFWEWLYTKNAGNFFWGDEFHIVRINKGCEMSECLVKKEIFILANDRDEQSDAFVEKLKSKLQEAGVKDSNFKVIYSPMEDIDFSVDCIILYAAGKDERIRGIYESKLKGIFIGNKILFFNLYPPGPLGLNGLPAAWIDSRFDNIKEEITLTFINCFFTVYLNERTNIRVTEIVAKTRKMMAGENILGRLECVVNGNPNITLTA
jgi:hypothetical protein